MSKSYCAILLLGGSVIRSLGLSKTFPVIPLAFGPDEKSRPVRFNSLKPPLLIGYKEERERERERER